MKKIALTSILITSIPYLLASSPTGTVNNINTGSSQPSNGHAANTSVTDIIASWGIPQYSYSFPLPGVSQELFPKVNAQYTLETSIDFDTSQVIHPEIRKLLFALGYNQQNTSSIIYKHLEQKDPSTTLLHVGIPYESIHPDQIRIKLRTLLNQEQLNAYKRKNNQ